MIKILNILSRTFCLLLMTHLLGTSVCDDYILKLINKSTTEQILDIEKDADNDSEDKTVEFDDFDSEYLVNPLSNFRYHRIFPLQEDLSPSAFQYLQIALTQSNNKILIPPPRA